jgi:hypothetical protein
MRFIVTWHHRLALNRVNTTNAAATSLIVNWRRDLLVVIDAAQSLVSIETSSDVAIAWTVGSIIEGSIA